jgi:hypothetical protein
MLQGMPVLGEDDEVPVDRVAETVDYRDNVVAASDGKAAAGTKVVLEVDYDERTARDGGHGFAGGK